MDDIVSIIMELRGAQRAQTESKGGKGGGGWGGFAVVTDGRMKFRE